MPQHLTSPALRQPRGEEPGGGRCAWGMYRGMETCGLVVSVGVCHVSLSPCGLQAHTSPNRAMGQGVEWGDGVCGYVEGLYV